MMQWFVPVVLTGVLSILIHLPDSCLTARVKGPCYEEPQSKCIDETLPLSCETHEVVTVQDITLSANRNSTRWRQTTMCSYSEQHCTALAPLDRELTLCLWKNSRCDVTFPYMADRLISCQGDVVPAHYFTVFGFRCLQSERVLEMCSTPNNTQLINETRGYILSPGHPVSYPTTHPCHVIIEPPEGALYFLFTLQSEAFSVFECLDYVLINMMLLDGSTNSTKFCGYGEDLVRIKTLAYSVNISFYTESGLNNLPGFRLRFTVDGLTRLPSTPPPYEPPPSPSPQPLPTLAVVGFTVLVCCAFFAAGTAVVLASYHYHGRSCSLSTHNSDIAGNNSIELTANNAASKPGLHDTLCQKECRTQDLSPNDTEKEQQDSEIGYSEICQSCMEHEIGISV